MDTENLIPVPVFRVVKLQLPNVSVSVGRGPEPTENVTEHAQTVEETADTPPVEPFRWRKVLGLSMVVVSSFLYCTSIAIAKQLPYISSAEICSVQCGVCLGMLSLSLTHQNTTLSVARNKVLSLVVISISGALGLLLTVYCVQHMRFGDAILLLYTAPLFTGLFAKIIFGERCGVVNFTSAFACFLGTLFTLQPGVVFSKMSHDQMNLSLTNCALAIAGAIALGVCYTALRVQGPGVSVLVTLSWLNLLLFPASVIVQLITKQTYTAPHCGNHRLYLLLSGVMMFFSLYLFFRALSRDNTAPAVLMRNTDVVIGYCYQAFWFKEDVDVLNLIGLVMIIGGVSAIFLHKLLKNVQINFRGLKYDQLEEEPTATQNT